MHAGFTFPRPWPDESHFLAPALQLARHGTLDVPQLNAPQGIFWLPHGYYVLLAPLLVLPVEALDAARWVSLVGVAVFAGAVALSVARRGASWGVAGLLCGAWLLLPRVVMAGDIARMEAPVLALAGLALVLAERERWPAAVAVASSSALVHPIGAVVALVFVVCGVAAGRRAWSLSRGDVVVVLVVVGAITAQAAYFLANWELTQAHLGFQLTRKAGRAISLDLVRGVLLALAVAGLYVRRRDALARLLLGLAAGLIVVAIVGREMWYEVLGTETALLLIVLAMLPVAAARRAGAVVFGVLGAVATIAAASATLRVPVFGMHTDTADRDEWTAFSATLVDDLRGVDRASGGRRTVLLDPLSGVGQELFAHRWRRLRFVQPTPVTPLETADLTMITPGAPFAGLPPPPQADLLVRSPNGVFTAILGAPAPSGDPVAQAQP